MRRSRFGLTLTGLLLLFALAAIFLTGPASVYANTRTEGAGHVPYYARIEGTEEPIHDEILAPIVFYRPPECIPADFNLLNFYDFEFAYGCEPPTTDGFMLWEGEPYLSNPQLIKLYGLGAVPVWFVEWPALQDAIADGELFIGELEDLPKLVGSAGFYNEVLHPGVRINLVARGTLEDGRVFQLHANLLAGGVPNVHLDMR
jgi:hypothetical protein